MSIWKFLKIQPPQILPLDGMGEHDVSRSPAIYVLFANEGEYRYPKGASPIFYIGMTGDLWRRLRRHRNRTGGLLRGSETMDWPRYAYGAAHGCRVAAFPVDATRHADLRSVESDVIALFAATYGAPPVANAAASLRKVLRRPCTAPPAGLTTEAWACPKPPKTERATNRARRSTKGDERPSELIERVLAMSQRIDPELELTSKVKYFSFSKSGKAFNFAKIRRLEGGPRLEIVLARSPKRDAQLGRNGLAGFNYAKAIGAYTVSLDAETLNKNKAAITELLREAYAERRG